jgi:hypothetical protein
VGARPTSGWPAGGVDPFFHQRFIATVTDDRIDGRWKAPEDVGKTWQKDLDLRFERRPRGPAKVPAGQHPAGWPGRATRLWNAGRRPSIISGAGDRRPA